MREKLRRFFTGEGISRPASILLRFGLALSSVMLAACLLLLVYAGPPRVGTHRLISLAAQLYREPQGVLLVVSLGAACVDGLVKGG